MSFRLRRDNPAVFENASVAGNVLVNDSEALQVTRIRTASGTYVTVTEAGTTLQGQYGYLTIWPDGSYTYRADLADRLRQGATNSDSFTYEAVGNGGSGSVNLNFAVTGINDAPVLTATQVALPSLTEDQTANDGRKVSAFLESSDVDSSQRGIAITGVDSGNGHWEYSIDGRATWLAMGNLGEGSALLLRGVDFVRFVPNGVSGTTAQFTYRAWDQSSGQAGTTVDVSLNGGATAFSSALGTASIAVGEVDETNGAPVGVASSASGVEDGPPITGRVQASDPDNDPLSFALVANSAVGGTVTINSATGDYSFDPAADFSGTASFRFTASDGSRTSSPATVTIAVAPVNDAPIARNDAANTSAGTPVLVDVLANDSDVDGDVLAIAAVGGAGHGTVAIVDGQVRYSPNAGFTGNDMFNYSISDGAGGTAQASATVTVGAASASGSAISLTFRQGANNYSGAVDTMLRQNRPTTPYDDAAVFRPTLESGKAVDALLRFDGLFGSGPGQIPVGSQIISATLQIQVSGASSAGGTLHRMLVGWNGASTWSSLGDGVQANGVEATSAGIALGAMSLGSRVIDVTSSIAAWYAAGTSSAQQNAANLGWLFQPGSTDPWEFSSSQGAVEPVLTITYAQAGVSAASLPTVSISAGAPATEGSGRASFTVSLSQASSQSVTVNLGTVDNLARSGSDFVASARSITFLPGETSRTFDVGLVNDNLAERLESFTVQINSASNARIDRGVATGRIVDDDVTVPAMPLLDPSVVAVHILSNGSRYDGAGSYGIADPSGLAYVPSLGTLFVADSEHDESPFNSQINLFALRLDGSYVRNHSLMSFSDEPTGLAYNDRNGYLYIADDDASAVSWVNPTNPSVRLGFFDTGRLGFVDTEDLKFDPLTGHIHVLDGLLRTLFELTADGSFVNAIPLPAVMKDGEALAYDSLHDLYFVAAGSAIIWVIDAEGTLKGTIDLLSSYSVRPNIKGMELAPSSNPSDGDALSLYVADYGSDQSNDGRMFEINLGSDWFT